MATFAEILKRLRERAGLTQPQLADRAGVPVSTLRAVEQGRRDPAFSTAVRLVRGLGVGLSVGLRKFEEVDLDDVSEALPVAEIFDNPSLEQVDVAVSPPTLVQVVEVVQVVQVEPDEKGLVEQVEVPPTPPESIADPLPELSDAIITRLKNIFFACGGRWPTADSGIVADSPILGLTWQRVDEVLSARHPGRSLATFWVR
jgi:transcriptional regulator with XRE-family HTH domain